MFIKDDYYIPKLDNVSKMTNEELDYNIDLFSELVKYFKGKCFSGEVKTDSLLQTYTTKWNKSSRTLTRLQNERIKRKRRDEGTVLKGKVQYLDVHDDIGRCTNGAMNSGFSLHGISI